VVDAEAVHGAAGQRHQVKPQFLVRKQQPDQIVDSDGRAKAMSDSETLTDQEVKNLSVVEVALLLGINAETLSLGTPTPFQRLAGLVVAARDVVREIRRCFPVEGETWAFAGCDSTNALEDAVFHALANLEGWLNPNRLPFDAVDRVDLDAIIGLPKDQLKDNEWYAWPPWLRTVVQALVNWHNRILQHYRVEEIACQRDPSQLWWAPTSEAISPELLEGLERAADLLVECLEGERAQRFLGCGPCPDGPLAEVAEPQARAATCLLSAPGDLGLLLDADRKEVRRKGRDDAVRLTGQLWKALELFVERGDRFTHKDAIAFAVWKVDRARGLENRIDACLSRLRKAIAPLGVDLKTHRFDGSRLVDSSGGNRSRV
jgi:hypothetical protein